jgi:hypothetical protein
LLEKPWPPERRAGTLVAQAKECKCQQGVSSMASERRVRDSPTLFRTTRGCSGLNRRVPVTGNTDPSKVALLPKELSCHIYAKDFVTLSGQRPRLGPGPNLGRIRLLWRRLPR